MKVDTSVAPAASFLLGPGTEHAGQTLNTELHSGRFESEKYS